MVVGIILSYPSLQLAPIMTLLLPKNDMVPKSKERPLVYGPSVPDHEFYLQTFPCSICLSSWVR